ncbi:hypothetical protein AAZX31_02G224900 [Glycine max]|uniref:Bromodomain associated domain-containing protein n=2 Tax=Glycine subgen. Soja TaxID=1462606 RepID=K7KAF5_SOYBN|nr:uncharacterized protein LOC102667916 [Glycine max]XP_028215595.1 uncharacterized protein LOC114397646 [Glycine soja]KAG5052884.1 hypothetical protein JHK87_005082 [Glycine soja]KAG5081184.1 hypothetical protein JHK86_005249 [Glycine max]KAH1061831.1 hypothetical protein GYH30_005036 [Glycine max]KAH1061832.1 hypothetical protein GYH30_005036 [Glycine max]KHN41022.1 hypothetical protein glysoja_013364 [Glycine soja]|eukprot:XP_006575468.1 uncharacterized protein LOC102667916 [Glycine max]
MNPMENNSSTNATSKLPQKAKRKKKGLGVNVAQVADNTSEFSFAVAKIAVAQICQSAGYKSSKHNALEALTNVSTRYMEAIVRSAATFANASNRTDSNLFDLTNGIHDVCSVQGFPGGSIIHKSNLLGSSALKEIMNFVNLSNKVPFAKPIPFRNVSEVTIDSGTSMCLSKQVKTHIPRWLPHFPKENCAQVLVKERKCDEKLWEHSLTREENSGLLPSNGIDGKEEKEARMELPKGRERIKFRIRGEKEMHVELGVNMMNGVCKGRKRVSWNHDKINDCMVEENEDEKR